MTEEKRITRETGKVRLKFIVAGGGIAGLATACTLRQAGHDVLVIEKGNGKVTSRGGVQSPPNMTKLLQNWGLGPVLDERAHKCDRFVFINGCTGARIGFMNMGDSFLQDLSADFLFLQHQDLYDMLFDLAKSSGVEFRFNTRIVDASTSPVCVSVVPVSTAANGEEGTDAALESSLNGMSLSNANLETLPADVLVGADGFDSLVRQIVTDSAGEVPDESDTHVVATMSIPIGDMLDDECLEPLLKAQNWTIWFGNGYVMNTNVMAGGMDFTATIIANYYGPRTPNDHEWTEKRSLKELGIELDNFEPQARRVLELAKTVSSRVYVRQLVPEDLVCANSRAVLVGEAAHPLLPAGNHGVAMVLEDAQTLGILFSRIRSRENLSQLLTAYEEIRRDYVASVYTFDYTSRLAMKIPPGPEMDERDAVLVQTMRTGEWDSFDDSETFRAVWGEELRAWTYDPTDRVEDWWSQYGSAISGPMGRSRAETEVRVATGDIKFEREPRVS